MNRLVLPGLLVLAACGSAPTGNPDGPINQNRGSYSIGMTQNDIIYNLGRPAHIHDAGADIQVWIYDARKLQPKKDDVVEPDPFSKEKLDVQQPRLWLRFERRILVEARELKPGEPH